MILSLPAGIGMKMGKGLIEWYQKMVASSDDDSDP
jgi:hypothetical protein